MMKIKSRILWREKALIPSTLTRLSLLVSFNKPLAYHTIFVLHILVQLGCRRDASPMAALCEGR
jgi:hypothetical protein